MWGRYSARKWIDVDPWEELGPELMVLWDRDVAPHCVDLEPQSKFVIYRYSNLDIADIQIVIEDSKCYYSNLCHCARWKNGKWTSTMARDFR